MQTETRCSLTSHPRVMTADTRSCHRPVSSQVFHSTFSRKLRSENDCVYVFHSVCAFNLHWIVDALLVGTLVEWLSRTLTHSKWYADAVRNANLSDAHAQLRIPFIPFATISESSGTESARVFECFRFIIAEIQFSLVEICISRSKSYGLD